MRPSEWGGFLFLSSSRPSLAFCGAFLLVPDPAGAAPEWVDGAGTPPRAVAELEHRERNFPCGIDHKPEGALFVGLLNPCCNLGDEAGSQLLAVKALLLDPCGLQG